jgi:hypothetical protein
MDKLEALQKRHFPPRAWRKGTREAKEQVEMIPAQSDSDVADGEDLPEPILGRHIVLPMKPRPRKR